MVIGDARVYVERLYKARPEVAQRLVYLSSPANLVLPDSTNQEIAKTWNVFGETKVIPAEEYLSARRTLLLYDDGQGYLLPLLLRDPSPYAATVKATFGAASLFRCEPVQSR